MTRIAPSHIAFTGAACALALAAAFAASARDSAAPPSASPGARPLSLVETLVLLRWGEGALDWNLPDSEGDRHARTPSRRP